MYFNKAKKSPNANCIRTQSSGFTLQKRYQQVTIAPTRKKLVASRSVVSAFTSEQHRRSVTFCGKGGTVERVTDFLRNKKIGTSVTRSDVAEREGFEPSEPLRGSHDFQSCALDQLSHLSGCKLYLLNTAFILYRLFPALSTLFAKKIQIFSSNSAEQERSNRLGRIICIQKIRMSPTVSLRCLFLRRRHTK